VTGGTRSNRWYRSGLKKNLQVIIHDSELTEISDVIDICDRVYWFSQSCDSRHVCRRNTAVAVTHSDPVGMLVCLGSLGSYTLCALKVSAVRGSGR